MLQLVSDNQQMPIKSYEINDLLNFLTKIEDVNIVSRTEGDIITVDGVEYINMTKFDVSPTFGDLKVYATGIFPDPELSMCKHLSVVWIET